MPRNRTQDAAHAHVMPYHAYIFLCMTVTSNLAHDLAEPAISRTPIRRPGPATIWRSEHC